MGTVVSYDVWYGPVNDGDAETLSTFTTEHDCTPDTSEGLTPVDLAVAYIRDKLYISGRYCASSWMSDATWPGPHTWFAAETYQHPYEDKHQEVTAHLQGWSDDDARAIWERVTAV